MRVKLYALGASALLAAAVEAAGGEPALVPAPRSVVLTGGAYSAAATSGTLLARDAELPRSAIRFETDAALPVEGYRLEITPAGVKVASADAVGAFYATRTLKQMSRVGGDRKKGFTLDYPCGTVTDAPAFRWRGFMLDEGRHFFGKEVVCRYLDLMADHKLNVFHWHLTEDQGWRLAIDRFPELVEYGAVRPESVRFGYTGRPKSGDLITNGEKYGPYFYTADDVREILAYAAARHITVIPEIEVPGHVRALLAAHPEFSCKGDLPRVPRIGTSIEDEVLCAGNDEAIRFVEQVYDEVMKLFPGAYFHLGGDECPKKRWKECPKCQARMKALGLKDEEELQGWFTRHFTEYLAKRGRRAIGWDEVLAGKPGLETVVQSWRANAIYAAKAVVPHWLPVSKDGCRAMRDCGATVICCTDGPRIAYEGDPSALPYGHAARVEHNRKPETALYRRVCNDVAIAASVAAYNHTSTAQTEETCGRLKYVYDKATGLAFKRFRSAPMLNLDRLEDLEREFSKSLKYDFMCFANHEQYFYSDYLAHQPDYGAKMLFASKFAHDHGYEFVFIEDTVD